MSWRGRRVLITITDAINSEVLDAVELNQPEAVRLLAEDTIVSSWLLDEIRDAIRILKARDEEADR